MHYYLMLLLSFAVVAAMQTVGVILVVAMLITPASTALLLRDRLPSVLLIAGIVGFISSVSGLILSILYEMPPGPTIAVTATAFYLLAAFFSPSKGLAGKYLRRKKQEKRIILEDILKAGYKISFSKPLDVRTLSDVLKQPTARIKRFIGMLVQQQLLRRSAEGQFQFTDAGRDHANKIIRAHRLWESYLVHEMGMDAAQIHEEAERYEHLLTAEQVDAVDKQLGYPAKDPHGSPIPSRENAPLLAMHTLQPDDTAVISKRQPGADITYRLWQLGIGPGDVFRVKHHEGGFVIQMNESEIRVPDDLATKVSVEKESPSLL